MVGTITQAAANSDVACIYAGRFVAGLGVGALSMLVPMFNAELAPPGIRGSLVALQQLAITCGSWTFGYLQQLIPQSVSSSATGSDTAPTVSYIRMKTELG